ncbi:uncharacterized protein LOC131172937 [Hevea brasiliensis]|uniref:uncharacterized protein LOC131172937 n=1 Tax=Hevea brasiliensis TaxID=3981 RepID=UPI0025DA4DFF|nr:uncharacterized protein LOC131172937 [Hevea brasiliensis]
MKVRSFLGLLGYYSRFVKGFSLITAPLTKLLHKSVKFDWNDKCQASFEKLKAMLTEVPVFTQLLLGRDFVVYSDASHNGFGCVLIQEGKVVAYASWLMMGGNPTATTQPQPPPPPQKSYLEKKRKYRAMDFLGKKKDDPMIDDAYQWWDTVSREVQLDQITWEFFLTEFKKMYVNNVYLKERRRKFISLRQRQLSVSEYEQEFVRLSRYGREIVPTEAKKCRRFEERLNDNIKLMITTLGITNFGKLVEAALKVERARINEQSRRDRQ